MTHINVGPMRKSVSDKQHTPVLPSPYKTLDCRVQLREAGCPDYVNLKMALDKPRVTQFGRYRPHHWGLYRMPHVAAAYHLQQAGARSAIELN